VPPPETEAIKPYPRVNIRTCEVWHDDLKNQEKSHEQTSHFQTSANFALSH